MRNTFDRALETDLSGRVSIDAGPDGETVIRIRASIYRRLVVASKEALVGLVLFTFMNLIRDSWSRDPAQTAFLVLGATIAVWLAAFARSGETIRVWEGVVLIARPLRSFQVSRSQQDAPQYSPVPVRVWSAQRWGEEQGSGVLIFGEDRRGVRFGEDLDEVEASYVLGAFAPDASRVEASRLHRAISGIVPMFTPLLAAAAVLAFGLMSGLNELAAVSVMVIAFFLLLLVLDAIAQHFPMRIEID